jgi:hypothetical protein
MFVCLLIVFLISAYTNVILVETDNPFIAGNPDFTTATARQLKWQSLVNYKKKFGAVPDEKTAISIAEKVLDEIYEDCSKTEQPFVVFFNTRANAWIVNGTLPSGWDGGTGYIAIEKDTGAILLLIHYA